MPARGLRLVLALAAIVAAGACGRQQAATPVAAGPPSIILISLDTTRHDRLGLYGYFRDTSPNLDALARSSIVFDRAYAPTSHTLPVHLSWLTAVYPEQHGILSNFRFAGWSFRQQEQIALVPELLAGAGYETAAFISAAPLKKGTGFETGFHTFSEPDGARRTARNTTDAVLDYLRTRDPSRPLFLFVHYFDPHGPHKPDPEFRIFRTDARLEAYLAERRIVQEAGQGSITKLQNQYDAEVRGMDFHIGRLLEELRRSGLLDRAALAVAADHGEGLGQHGELGHGDLWDEQLRVGWLLRLPGGARGGTRVADLVSTVDLFPTVFRNARVPVPDRFWAQAVGVDALDPRQGRAYVLAQRAVQPSTFAGTELRFHLDRPKLREAQYAVVTPEWKLLYTPSGRELLYRIDRDPFELSDVRAAHGSVAAALRRQAETQFAAARSRAVDPSDGGRLTARRIEELKALGYIH